MGPRAHPRSPFSISGRTGRRIGALGAAILLCSASLVAGIVAIRAGAEESGWTKLDPEALTEEQAARREKAWAARNKLASKLRGALLGSMEESGPAGSISVCREKAPELAREISSADGVKIGRTSFRLRNPANRHPGWASAAVESREAAPTYYQGPSGELGAIFPIRIQQPCLTCHGPRDTIPGPVREEIGKLYPEDRATGFARGDLRGWFWVEVP